MKKWFSELSSTYKTAFISLIIVVVGFLGLVFGYFVNQPDLPNGFLAGGLIGVLSYYFMGLTEARDLRNEKPVLSIVITIIRFLVIGGVVVLSALLQFKFQYKVLNTFLILGGYVVSLITFVIVLLVEKKNV